MKKIFIAAFLLPFSLFAVEQFPDQLYRIMPFKADPSSGGISQTGSYSPYMDQSALFDWFMSHSNAIRFNSSANLLIPEINALTLSAITNKTISHSFSVQGLNQCWYSTLKIVPELSSLYTFCARMYISGLQSGFYNVTTNASNQITCTLIPVRIFADALVSTNTLFRSEALNYLSSINNSLSNIDIGVSSILSLLSSSSSPSYTASNVLARAVALQQVASMNGFELDINKFEDDLNPDNYDSSPESQKIFQSLVDSYGQGLDQLSKLVGLASSLNPDFPVDSRNNGLQQLGNAFNGSVDASVNDFKRLSTNWQEGVKKDLQDWRNDVTNRLAHMFDDNISIDGGNTTPVYVSGQNGGPVSVAGVVRIDQQIPVGVTISAPITIDPTQFNQFSSGWESIVQAVTDFHDYFTSWASNGDIGFGWVRYYSMMYDFSQNTLTNQLAQISLLSSLTNLFANYADNFTNNVIFSISNALAGLTSVSNDYMLLSDYANYINSHGLVDLIDVMDDDTYSAFKDELLGISSLDQADSYGRWWRYFTGLQTINANSNYKLANLFIGHDKTLKDLKDSSGSDSLLDKFQQLFELIPSPTDIMDKTGNMTNSIDRSGFASLVDQSSFMSNYFNRVEMFFNRGSSLPANISINLGFGNKPGLQESPPIVLPLDKYRGVMDLLHYGIAFSYCIVNLILLPKFLLILIHLFDRVWKGYDKKLSDAVQA